MPPTVPLPNTSLAYCEITVRGIASAGGSTTHNAVWKTHWKRANLALALSRANIVTAFNTALAAKWLDCLHARFTFLSGYVRFIDDPLSATTLHTIQAAGPVLIGTVTGDGLAMHNQLFLLERTALRGRHYTGRKNLFPLGESQVTTANHDLFNAAALTTFGTFASAYLAGFTDSDGNVWTPQVLSASLSDLKVQPAVIVANPVTQILVNKRVGVSRRREVASVY